MKKIIDNKIYDTTTANKIYEFRRKCDGGRSIWFPNIRLTYCTNVQIYKTNRENYFLHYDKYDDCEEKIEVITEQKVKDIIREIDPDKYIELFGSIDLEEA